MFRSAIASGECTPYDVYENGGSMLWVIVSSPLSNKRAETMFFSSKSCGSSVSTSWVILWVWELIYVSQWAQMPSKIAILEEMKIRKANTSTVYCGVYGIG